MQVLDVIVLQGMLLLTWCGVRLSTPRGCSDGVEKHSTRDEVRRASAYAAVLRLLRRFDRVIVVYFKMMIIAWQMKEIDALCSAL